MADQHESIEIAGRIIRHFEGMELTSYIFPGEENLQATVGYGHAIPLSQHPLKITKQESADLLAEDIKNRVLSLKGKMSRKIFDSLTDCELASITSWAYNCKGWATSDTFEHLKSNHREEFIEATSDWIRGEGSKVLAGLVRRRACERHIFTRGSIEEVLSLDWYMPLVTQVNAAPNGKLEWSGSRLVWTAL